MSPDTQPPTTVHKAVYGALGTVLTVLAGAFTDDVISTDEQSNIIGSVLMGGLTVFMVWKAKNRPKI